MISSRARERALKQTFPTCCLLYLYLLIFAIVTVAYVVPVIIGALLLLLVHVLHFLSFLWRRRFDVFVVIRAQPIVSVAVVVWNCRIRAPWPLCRSRDFNPDVTLRRVFTIWHGAPWLTTKWCVR